MHWRANDRFMLEGMARASARFPTQFMRKWKAAYSLLTGFTNPQDYQGQPLFHDLFSQKNISGDLQTAKK